MDFLFAMLSGVINKEDEAEVIEFACKTFVPSGDIVVSAIQIAVKNELQTLEELQEEAENE